MLAIVFISLAGYSQDPGYIADGALLDGKTIVKASISGLGVRNFGFSAERIVNKNLSANVGIRFMPDGGIPMLSTVNKYIQRQNTGEDEIDVESYLSNIRINSFAFTPELRIYPGKHGYGRGFYIAPYYNYFAFNLSELTVEEEFDGKMENAVLDGSIKTHSGGILFGYQWMLGAKKNIIIDWGIFGIHGGKSAGELNGKTSKNFDNEEQTIIKDNLEDFLSGIPLMKFTTDVEANSVKITEKGPWAFLRGSISVGFRF